MTTPFEVALGAAVDLLRTLPRDRQEMTNARSRFADFRKDHPETPARLLVDCRPGWPEVEHDILLEHPGKGTVAVTWRPDEGKPWSIDYADHWASNLLLSIDSGGASVDVTVQGALLFLKMAAEKQSDLMERIVEQKLLAMSAEADPPPVSQEELQEAADEFRAANGMLTAESTERRLREWGVSLAYFQQMLTEAIQRRKVRERITEEEVEPYFDAHRLEFERARCLLVATPARALAERIAGHARCVGLAAAAVALTDDSEAEGIEAELTGRFVRDLAHPLAAAAPGILVGPFEHEGRWCLGRVLERRPARLDAETREAIRQVLYRRWLQEKRDGATVKWHWM